MNSFGINVPRHVFRAYDVRGLTPDPLSTEFAFALGRAVAALARQSSIDELVIGRDGRHSSAGLARAFGSGLCASGVNVIDIGLVSTPVLYFAAHSLTEGNGAMITASHNPPAYNGFKVDLDGQPLSAEQWAYVRQVMEHGSFVDGKGSLRSDSVNEAYVQEILGRIQLARSLTVVVDGSNGPGGEVLTDLLRRLGCRVSCIGCDIDGDFSRHPPDPSQPGNYSELAARVLSDRADVGIMLDGDADRIGVVDSKGNIVWPDTLLVLFARDVLNEFPGAKVVFDVKCSARLPEAVQLCGGEPVMWKSGHALTRRKMKEIGALLAGEFSGHILCADKWFGFDDGIFAACRLLQILAESPGNGQEVFDQLPRSHSTPELRIALREGEAQQVMTALRARAEFLGGKVTDIDGIRIEFPTGWALVRASNTLPALTLRFEAKTPADLDLLRRRIEKWVDDGIKASLPS